MEALTRDILEFWLGDATAPRAEWFRKDSSFDDAIRVRFGSAVEAAIDGAYESWRAEPRGALALILLLDQFTRNIYRDTPKAFAGDARALSVAVGIVDAGNDRPMTPYERMFVYLPFEHAEDRAMQDRSIELFTRLDRETPLKNQLEWAEKHAVIIRRFGRYPHRNAILGRTSTPEEIAFLAQPGSGF
jgi:uncharacterized protein (DUF924 family)